MNYLNSWENLSWEKLVENTVQRYPRVHLFERNIISTRDFGRKLPELDDTGGQNFRNHGSLASMATIKRDVS